MTNETNTPVNPWSEMDGESAKLVGQILTASIDSNFRTMEMLEGNARADARKMAEAFLGLYRLVKADERLPRYTLDWVADYAGDVYAAQSILSKRDDY